MNEIITGCSDDMETDLLQDSLQVLRYFYQTSEWGFYCPGGEVLAAEGVPVLDVLDTLVSVEVDDFGESKETEFADCFVMQSEDCCSSTFCVGLSIGTGILEPGIRGTPALLPTSLPKLGLFSLCSQFSYAHLRFKIGILDLRGPLGTCGRSGPLSSKPALVPLQPPKDSSPIVLGSSWEKSSEAAS
jgi:hypothetical protein